MSKARDIDKRRNRTVGIGEALGAMLDPLVRRRGFANMSLMENWRHIAPPPYGDVTFPDKLQWPRNEGKQEGAILYLRCAPGHALTVSHEGTAIVQAVNRFFGFVLVRGVKLSAEPFTARSDTKAEVRTAISERLVREVDMSIDEVSDEGLKTALHQLGLKVLKPNRN